jgi:hypothetical protein
MAGESHSSIATDLHIPVGQFSFFIISYNQSLAKSLLYGLGIIFDFEDRLRELKFTLLGRGS